MMEEVYPNMDLTLESLMEWLVHFVESMGYAGIFLFTLIESTFIPIPSEMTMIPAGYLVSTGQFKLVPLFLSSVSGSVAGAFVNYWLALRYGRLLFVKYGRLFMLKPEKLAKIENYFVEHGAISVFTGRLLPGVKHYISFPAGLARMPLKPFLLYSLLSGALWMAVLIGLGYLIGRNEDMIGVYLHHTKNGITVFVFILIAGYWLYRRHRKGAA